MQVADEKQERILIAKISDIKIGDRMRKKLHNIPSLAKSIAESGLLHPILLDQDMNLIAGFRRIKAFEYSGKSEIPARIDCELSSPYPTRSHCDVIGIDLLILRLLLLI